jgi:hypothetical protein
MCRPASFVLTKGHRVWWLKASDSHEDILDAHRLYADGIRGPNIVRVELYPSKGDFSLPLDQWVFKTDQGGDWLPDWFDPIAAERETRAELRNWARAKLAGWNVQEAFHPVNPLNLPVKELPAEELARLIREWKAARTSWTSASANLPTLFLVKRNIGARLGSTLQDLISASIWNQLEIPVRPAVRKAILFDEGGGSKGSSSEFDPYFLSSQPRVWSVVLRSIEDAVGAYLGGLFPPPPAWPNPSPPPWRPLLKLWYSGYLPTWDNNVWRLHAGPDAKIMFKLKGAKP